MIRNRSNSPGLTAAEVPAARPNPYTNSLFTPLLYPLRDNGPRPRFGRSGRDEVGTMQGTAIAWGGVCNALDALVAADGTAAHRHPLALTTTGVRRSDRAPSAARRDLADALHALLAVHGDRPGLADEAAARVGEVAPRGGGDGGIAADWLGQAAAGLADERDALARLVVAAGPLPSTPGQAATDAAFAAQRHAFRMLARSDRAGVATGAVAALALDWRAMRRVLLRAADAFGVTLARPTLPAAEETATVLGLVGESPSAERALLFGARALLDQHRALWTLLEARASARSG